MTKKSNRSKPIIKGKQVSVYGTTYANGRKEKRRYEFIGGSGRRLYSAVREALRHPPNKRIVRLKVDRGKPIIGYTDPSTVMLDLDDMGLEEVKYWATSTCKDFKLGGYLIIRSSERNHHVLFNRPVSWAENVRILAWVCLTLRHESLTNWFLYQCTKKEPTLRISVKGEKPLPKIVFRHGEQDGQIKGYLLYRKYGRLVNREHTKRGGD